MDLPALWNSLCSLDVQVYGPELRAGEGWNNHASAISRNHDNWESGEAMSATCPTCGYVDRSDIGKRRISPLCLDPFHSQPAPSRSIARRLAAQRGEPVPEFAQQAPSQSAGDSIEVLLQDLYIFIDNRDAAAAISALEEPKP